MKWKMLRLLMVYIDICLSLERRISDSKRRATDNNWSRKTFQVRSHYRKSRTTRLILPRRRSSEEAFVREELMLIPEDTQKPPELGKRMVDCSS